MNVTGFLLPSATRWAALLVLGWLCQGMAAPTVIVTNLPAYGSFDNLKGVALGADPETSRIAVFIFVPGYGWVTKPTCAQPLTAIQPDGSWAADITTGGSDALATRVAALLVGTNYNQPCVQGLAFLPTNVFTQASASTVITRPSPAVRWLSFSGYDWWVKAGNELLGPGPNYFSDSTNNVWLDTQGQLHLRITNRSNQWQCAELVSARSFGHGSYRFELVSRVDNLDPNIVLGLFTWSDDPAYADREIDIECSRWGNAADTNNAQYVVQPYETNGHLVRFAVPAGETHSTLLFTWETNRVSFQSLAGSYSPVPPPASVISNWVYTLAVPQAGDENVRLNLWLQGGAPPSDGQEAEVVIKSFEFVPLEPPQPVTLSSFKLLSSGQVRFTMNTQPDRRYQVLSSTNLVSWNSLATFLATNTPSEFRDTAALHPNTIFYRIMTLP